MALNILGERERKIRKLGAGYRRQWRKVHLSVDAHALELRSIKVTDDAIKDALVAVGGR